MGFSVRASRPPRSIRQASPSRPKFFEFQEGAPRAQGSDLDQGPLCPQSPFAEKRHPSKEASPSKTLQARTDGSVGNASAYCPACPFCSGRPQAQVVVLPAFKRFAEPLPSSFLKVAFSLVF